MNREKIEVWQDMYQLLTNAETWVNLSGTLFKILAILVVAMIVIRISKRAIEGIIMDRIKGPIHISEKRSKTLTVLIHNVVKNVIYFISLLLILGELNFELAPLLAGAGVIGLAIGFGAQHLVRDVITGFLIIYEDQFSVGDMIETGKYRGVVQEIGLRLTKLKEFSGQVHMIPNGQITEVTNFSKHNSMAVVDVSIAYEENIIEAEKAIEEISMQIYHQQESMVGEPKVLGVQELGNSEVILRVVAECLPMQHFGVARVLRKAIKMGLDERGIEIPYPRLVTYRREE